MRWPTDKVLLSGWLAAVFGASAVVAVVAIALIAPRPKCPSIPSSPVPGYVAAGTVADVEHRSICGATAYLSIFDGEGRILTKVPLPMNGKGWFYIQNDNIPDVPGGRVARISAEGRFHLAESVEVALARGTPNRIVPKFVHLRLTPINPWLTLIVLLPATFGVILALLHLTNLARGVRVTQLYAIGTAVLWGVVMAVLIAIYARQGHALMPLFFADLSISSGVVVFAVLGCLTYLAFSLEEKDREVLFMGTSQDKQRILQVVGGRILIGPYVALAGYAIFAATFPNLRSGAFAAFFGFFTGAWIKPVLQALNDIGFRLLSREQQDKILQHALATEGPPRPVTSVDFLPPPSAAYLAAVAAAQEKLLELNGVLGVDKGYKLVGGAPTGDRAIVVYVEKKLDMAPADPELVPPSFLGIPTDVRELPPPQGDDDHCYAEMLSVSQRKIALLAGPMTESENDPQSAPNLSHHEDVWILLDDERRFFPKDKFAALNAYRFIRNGIGDTYDFIAFVIDRASGLPAQDNYCTSIHTDAEGLGFRTNLRGEWGSTKLRSVQVHTRAPALRTAMHEIVHTWAARIDLDIAVDSSTAMRTGAYHWSDFIDYGNSCLNASRTIWVPAGTTPDGTATARREAQDSDDSVWGLCTLDRYLMGLLPKSKVELRFFAPSDIGGVHPVLRTLPLSALRDRNPPLTQPKPNFRQAWVVVTASAPSGQALASEVSKKLDGYQKQFNVACQGAASLEIVRAKGLSS
jgi:hypothetical protein